MAQPPSKSIPHANQNSTRDSPVPVTTEVTFTQASSDDWPQQSAYMAGKFIIISQKILYILLQQDVSLHCIPIIVKRRKEGKINKMNGAKKARRRE
jgi:hypothetical protein